MIVGRIKILMIKYNTTPDLELELMRFNDGKGVEIVLKNSGMSSLMKIVAAIVKGGTISQIGYFGKQDPKDLDGLLPALVKKVRPLQYETMHAVSSNLSNTPTEKPMQGLA